MPNLEQHRYPIAALEIALSQREAADLRRQLAHARLVHELQQLPGARAALALAADVAAQGEEMDRACCDALHVLMAWLQQLGQPTA